MPYLRILVGVDGSDTAATALRSAARTARALDAELLLVSAFGPIDPVLVAAWKKEAPSELEWKIGARQRTEELLKEAAIQAREFGVEPITRVEQGSPADVLVETAITEQADLIVVGNRGMGGTMRFLLGSVPNSVTHHAPCDVWIVNTEGPHEASGVHPTDSILIATDGSRTAERAVAKGFELAGRLDAEVTLVRAGDPEEGERLLAEVAAVYAGDSVVFTKAVPGSPATVICEIAEHDAVDLIIVGNRGMTSPARFLLSSVPNQVSHYASCDVLIMKTT